MSLIIRNAFASFLGRAIDFHIYGFKIVK